MSQCSSEILSLERLFCCPGCRGRLLSTGDTLYCTGCSRGWPIIAGIPQFVQDEDLQQPQMDMSVECLIEIAAERGWRNALNACIGSAGNRRSAYILEYATSEARADFRLLMPIDENATVLDVGSGWGNIAIAFARDCARVIALDSSQRNLRFLQIRAQQEGLDNIVPVRADALNLPLPPQSCDIALMVGVLEWVGWGRSSGDPGRIQQDCLKGVYEVLRPGGCLYLAIENRYGFQYFLGRRDPHTHLRFITLMPRRLASFYSRAVRGRDYREYTHSESGLRDLVRAAGFRQIDLFFPVPGYQVFRFITDFSSASVDRFLLSRMTTHPKFTKFLHLANLAASLLHVKKKVAPCFSVIARK